MQNEYTYKTTDQGELKLHVDYPAGWREGDRRAGIVLFFGGGWEKGTVEHLSRHTAYLAGRGMVGVRADYRIRSVHGVTPLACVEDAKSAVRWVRAHAGELGMDPSRIAAGGGSAGAHIAACAALVDGFDAAGDDRSVSSAGDALVLFNPPLVITPERAERSGISADDARRISPLLHLARGAPPTVLFFGTADKFYADGQAFVARAGELGVRAEIFAAEGQPHAYYNDSPWFERTLRQADEFLASLGYLSGPPTMEAPL